jgi:hypothetical protein
VAVGGGVEWRALIENTGVKSDTHSTEMSGSPINFYDKIVVVLERNEKFLATWQLPRKLGTRLTFATAWR